MALGTRLTVIETLRHLVNEQRVIETKSCGIAYIVGTCRTFVTPVPP
ncbi:MAG: hypothetical protein ACI35Q_08675 [Marinilabiliaceae bacterium]